VFFTNAGAEAVENAVRLAKGYTGRMKVLSAYRSYHGGTALTVGLTGEPRRLENEPSVPGLVKFWGPYPYRSAFHSSSPEEETERALQHLRDTIVMEGVDKIAAIILEPVVGTNGILVPPPGYLEGLRALCDEFGIVWIADEVMAGFGRTGQWFAWQNWGAQPDLICFAKGVNSGYVPLGGVVISSAIAHAYDDKMFPGGLTYSGHPLACATAVASIGIFEEEDVLATARHLGDDIIGPALRGHGRTSSVGRRGARPRRVLGGRARDRSGDAGACTAVDRRRRRRRVQAKRPVAAVGRQPHPRGAAVQHPRRSRPRGPRHPRRGPRRRRRRHVLTRSREQLRLQGADLFTRTTWSPTYEPS
jgi:glutamate-1-semialdehyde aminotransferase